MKKKNLNIFLVIIAVASLLVACFFITRKSEYKEETSAGDTGTTVFESIGKYAFASAGNNNADRGTAVSTGVAFIKSEPTTSQISNWESTRTSLANSGISYSNMSGSYLPANGTIKKAIHNTIKAVIIARILFLFFCCLFFLNPF